MEERNWFPLAKRSVSTSRYKGFFSKIGFSLADRNVQIKEYCFK